ncbi:MAG: glycerol acyltransferase, partial [Deltaproteobacteria bacterium]
MQRYDIDSLDNRDPRLIARAALIGEKVLEPYFRADFRGFDRIPRGAALLVGNHNGGLMIPEA